jgi:hypothetical protein
LTKQCTTKRQYYEDLDSTFKCWALSRVSTDDRHDIHPLQSTFKIQSTSVNALEKRKPQGGRTNNRRTRRSKRGGYGHANLTYDEIMQSRILENVKAKRLVANTIQQTT